MTSDQCPHDRLADAGDRAVCEACGELLSRDEVRRRRQLEFVRGVRQQLRAKGQP